jgi:hypothetical protein
MFQEVVHRRRICGDGGLAVNSRRFADDGVADAG